MIKFGDDISFHKHNFSILGSRGCGAVGRVAAYDTRDLQFEFSHLQFLLTFNFVKNCTEKTEYKEKRCREWHNKKMSPFLAKTDELRRLLRQWHSSDEQNHKREIASGKSQASNRKRQIGSGNLQAGNASGKSEVGNRKREIASGKSQAANRKRLIPTIKSLAANR